ncbi:MAG: glucosaminidase domain-containing protein [Actinobacteria bacterium]|nr:glucosaminidase domain-containing protein [Actinomycetota bacterium]
MSGGVEAVQARIAVIESRLRALAGRDFSSILEAATSSLPARSATLSVSSAATSERARRLEAYMRSRNYNPALAAEAESFVEAADTYGMDWRLATALAAVESSGGRECFRPYNPFGIMGRDFNSFREAVYEVNRLVRSYGFGNDIRAILAKYNPGGGEGYIRTVLGEMEKM